jgi:hypothetical protein
MASSAAVADDKLKPTKTGVLDSKKDSAEAAVAVSYWELFRWVVPLPSVTVLIV